MGKNLGEWFKHPLLLKAKFLATYNYRDTPAYLSRESFPPLSGGQMVAVEPDAVWLLNAMCTEHADVSDESHRLAGVVREPDEMHDVGNHVQRIAWK